MLNNLRTPHEYPGKLFVVEGIDGSGKTTQLALLAKWLSAAGLRVFVTEWNSSALVKAATRMGKKKNSLTPTTFSLLHATDFADRLLYNVVPPLKAGMIVIADRYAYTAFARDVARGVDGTFMWLMEEVGELAAALREGTLEEQSLEFADVLAWLTTIANVAGVDLSAAVQKKYGGGCPGCGHRVCTCDDSEKP